MPIVFVHRGYSPYLEFSLRQARAASPDSDIVLLGTPENDRFDRSIVRHVDTTTASFRSATAPLRAAYRHRSTNREVFERVCLERWVEIAALAASEGWSEVLALDTDVMLYATEAEVRDVWTDPGTVLAAVRPDDQSDYRWCTSGGVAWWRRDALDAFSDFLVETYATPSGQATLDEKWDWHRTTGTPGGICDMSLLHLYANTLPRDAWTNLADVRQDANGDGVTHDQNAVASENLYDGEYRMEAGRKALEWRDGKPYGDNVRRGDAVRFHTLHFGGPSKPGMAEVYRGPRFNGQAALSRRMRRYYAARAAAGRVKAALNRGLARLRS